MIGFLLPFIISYFTIAIGINSFAQCIAGGLVGVIVHFYITRIPHIVIFFNLLFEVFFIPKKDGSVLYLCFDQCESFQIGWKG
jgi:hypothetical protein